LHRAFARKEIKSPGRVIRSATFRGGKDSSDNHLDEALVVIISFEIVVQVYLGRLTEV